ncbi:MAG: hypothetical protein M0P58_11460 [Bacteroidales bacterium]|jgi:hypothetical protein|nr:hypothetical protein [Bacteroidales bacterium]
MKNISKHALLSSIQASLTPVKNMARPSEMTAFSFDNCLKHLAIHWLNSFKQASFMALLLRFTSQNETSESSLMPTLKTPLIRMQWQPLTKGGIVLFRLLVSI